MTLDPNPEPKPQLSPTDEATLITGVNGDETVEVVRGELANYDVLSEIARGGMGVVYKARQISADRLVALKVVRGHDPDAANVERFLIEARAAARLDHPNIVPVYEVGEFAGEPYFSMRLIDGPSLSQQLGGQPLPCRTAAALVKTIANAIQYAHDHGIIHRDLKPGNILVDQSGQPHVTDFGLARMIDGASELTQSGQVVGTPSYMPPEQALGQREKVDERSDIYSVGAVLYACLTGRPPFRAASATATIMQLITREVVPPGRLNSETDVDVEIICLKCLEKEPRQRYATAREVAEDLQRYLDRKPIVARPASRWERVSKWAKRNPMVAGLSGFAAVAVMALLIGGVIYQSFLTKALGEAQTARDQAIEAEEQRSATLYDSLVEQADSLNKLRPIGYGDKVLSMMDQARQLKAPDWSENQLRHLAVSSMGSSASRTPVEFPAFPSQPLSFNASPDGLFIFVGMESGQVAICDRNDLAEHKVFSQHSQPILGIRFPDERTCYTASIFCGEILKWTFDGTSWQPDRMLNDGRPEGATDIRLSQDGRYVIGWTGCSPPAGTTQYVCSETPQVAAGFPAEKSVFYVREVESAENRLRLLPIPASAAFDIRDHVLVSIDGVDPDPQVLYYDLSSGETRNLGKPDFDAFIALSPNLDFYVAGSYRGSASHSTSTGDRIGDVLNASTYSAQFVGDSSSLLSVRGSGSHTIVPLNDPERAWRLNVTENPDQAVFASDGSCVFEFNTASGKAMMSQTAAPECQVWRDDQRAVDDVNFSRDGTVILSSRDDKHIQLRSTRTGRVLAELPGSRAVLHPSGEWLAVATWGSMQILQVPELQKVCHVEITKKTINRLRFSDDGQFLLAYGWDGPNSAVLRFVPDAKAPQLTLLTELDTDCNSAAWSPQGNQLAWISRRSLPASPRVMLRDFDATESDAMELGVPNPYHKFCSLVFCSQQRLALFDQKARLQSWDLTSDTLVHVSKEKFARPMVASSDGQYLLASGTLVRTETLEEVFRFPDMASNRWCLDWCFGGDQIAFGCNGGEIAVWNLPRVHAALQSVKLDFPANNSPHIVGSKALATLRKNPHASAQKSGPVVQLDDATQWKSELAGIEKRFTLDELKSEIIQLAPPSAEQIPTVVERLYAASELTIPGDEEKAIVQLAIATDSFAKAHQDQRLTLEEYESLMESCLEKFESLDKPSILSRVVTALVLDQYSRMIIENEARATEALRYKEACVQQLQLATTTGVITREKFSGRWYWLHIRCAVLAKTHHRDDLAIRAYHEAFQYSDLTGFQIQRDLQQQYVRDLLGLLAANPDVPNRLAYLKNYSELLHVLGDPMDEKSWVFRRIDPAVAEFGITAGAIELSVSEAGTKPHHAQITMHPFLIEGNTYRLSFEARSTAASTINFEVSRGELDYISVGLQETLALTQEFRRHTYSFVAKGVTSKSRVSFNLGTEVGDLQLRTLTLKEVLPASVGGE